jgi:hypothetical protein
MPGDPFEMDQIMPSIRDAGTTTKYKPPSSSRPSRAISLISRGNTSRDLIHPAKATGHMGVSVSVRLSPSAPHHRMIATLSEMMVLPKPFSQSFPPFLAPELGICS